MKDKVHHMAGERNQNRDAIATRATVPTHQTTMSVVDNAWTRTLYARSLATGNTLVTSIFGDRTGFTLFLGALLFVATYWRIGIFITDNYTIANTLVNVAEGHLHVTHVIYGPDAGATPGMKITNGRLYGLHYGVVFGALPFLWGFQALGAVADLRIGLVALWSLLALAFCLQLGTLLDRERAFALGGSVIVLGLFVLNVSLATPLEPRWLALMALQTSTMVWAALIAVFLYRLTAHLYGRRTGAFAGAAVVAATPIAFWASIPKRHVLVALLALLTIYCFYRSRAEPDHELGFRALAYVFIGVSAWVFPLEALLLLVALGPIDVMTARSNAPRQLAIVAGAFSISLLPFFLTNTLITGQPLRPIWFLPQYSGEEQLLVGGTDSASGGTGSTGGGNGGGGSPDGTRPGFGATIVPFVLSIGNAAIAHLDLLWSGYINQGFMTILAEPDRLYNVFIRSGYIERVAQEDGGQAINLALLESMPLLAALAALPAVAVRNDRARTTVRAWLASPAGQTDLLVGTYTLLITLTYLPELPTFATVTVRYLVPILPGLVYLIIRLAPIRTAIQTAGRTLLFTYMVVVVIGGQLLVLVLLLLTPSLGEAIQLHAWFGLATALPLGAWALLTTVTDREAPWVGAVLLGLAAGATTVFLLLSGFMHFSYAGDFALPLSQRVSEALALG